MKPLVQRGVTIKVGDELADRTVPADTLGRWAVHVSVNDGARRAARPGYTVTHIPSGLAVAAGQPYATAVKIARALDERCDVEVWGKEHTDTAEGLIRQLTGMRFPGEAS